MSLWNSVQAVVGFELRRSLTVPRFALWSLMVAFPAVLIAVMRYSMRDLAEPDIDPTAILYGLIPEFTCLAGLCFWMSPAIHSELESRTWAYLAVRPHGRRAVLLGKYVTALLWTIGAGWLALALALPIANPPQMLRSALVLAVLVVLSCVGRAAAFALLAVINPARAMVFGVVYSVLFEFVVGRIPAVINQFTVQLRLHSLLIHWMDWQHESPGGVSILLINDPAPPIQHVLLLLLFTAIVLTTAILVLEQRQFPSSDEG